ncbi:MAG: carboxypeptidase regulatory-like domain-containing protein, partial [Gemmatimonadaceae bacterium]
MRRFAPCFITLGFTVIFGSSTAAAQSGESGRIVGRVIDAATGMGITDAGVQVVGTTLGVQTGVEGRYVLPKVPAGTITITVRRLGYTPKTVTGLFLEANKTLDQSISLNTVTVQLQAQVTTASAERGNVNDALDAQRTSVGVVNSVTAEQIAKSPDANAAQAAQRVSGVTITDGRYIAVRGLSERYTTSSLNGARMPSPEPEKRMVPLDMFPAGLVQSITTSKTFTPDQPGDFSGAQVDIKTKEFPARRTWSLSLGSGYEAQATGSKLLSAATVGGEGFAMVNGKRNLPSLVHSAGNFTSLNLSQGDKNLLISQFRNSWSPTTRTALPLVNGSLSFGGNDPVLFGHRLGYLVSGTLSSATDLKSDQVRALADRGNVRGETVELDRFSGQSVQQSVLWGGLANLSTLVGGSSRLSFNALYNRTADNTARVEDGYLSSSDNNVRITRMQYLQRAIHSFQLAGEHQFGERQRFEWYGTLSGVRRDEPDKSEFVQVLEQDTPSSPSVLRWFGSGNGGAVRTFSQLEENSREASGKYSMSFGPAGRQSTLRLGSLYRMTDRTTDNRAFNISGRNLSNAVRELPPEQLFDGRFTTPSSNIFDIGPLSQGGAYDAHDRLAAAFAMAEIPVTDRIRVIGGARYEKDQLQVNATSTLGSAVRTKKDWGDLLPSLAVNL